ncbi:MAG: T9SS type A sorting domain-containing protein [Chitinophagales bacterium]|nr:T9SS type A sorting domain-containing protein [Chitinophagales bacterium]
MMKPIKFLMAVFAPLWMSAQSLSPTVISSTGGFSSNANGSLSYTVGEMTMVQTFSAGGNILTQGFQQPNDQVVGLLDMTKDDFGSFVVYPNPAVDNLWFGYQFPEPGRVALAVYDVLGQKMADLYNGNYDMGKTTDGFAVANFSAGTYFLSLTFTSDKDNRTRLISKPFQVIH